MTQPPLTAPPLTAKAKSVGRMPQTPPEVPVIKGHGKRSGKAAKAPKGEASGSADKGVKGGKWDNLPTTRPQREGRKGGQQGAPRRSGGKNAGWYRQYYHLKKVATDEDLRAWLEKNPHP